METIKTIQYVRLVTGLHGDEPVSFDTKNFFTTEEAMAHWKKYYRDRKEGDEYDKIWNALPFMPQLVITTLINKW